MSSYAKAGAFLVVGTRSMKLRRFAILSSVFVCFSTAPAFARTLVVDNDGAECPQAEYTTIQQAVAAAQAGDKILVCPSGPNPYLGTVLVTESNLRIEAQGAPGEVVLQGTSAELAGFYLLNTTGVLVQGFTVQGFGIPSPHPGEPPFTIQGANIRIEGEGGNTIRKNITTLSLMGDGIQMINSSANVVEQNTSSHNTGPNGDGIQVLGELALASNNIIRHNETSENGQTGINIAGTGTGNIVFGNRSHHNSRIGIRNVSTTGTLAGSPHGTVIENNHVFENGLAPPPGGLAGGILVGASPDVIVRNNRSERNSQFGIRVQNGAVNNRVEKNDVFGNILVTPAGQVGDGIQLVGGPLVVANNTVQLNLIRQNGRDGIRANALTDANTIERNVIRESGEHDAHDDSVGPFAPALTANEWINNKCETENRVGLCKNP
jgi:parallel beta-helix repeat protein